MFVVGLSWLFCVNTVQFPIQVLIFKLNFFNKAGSESKTKIFYPWLILCFTACWTEHWEKDWNSKHLCPANTSTSVIWNCSTKVPTKIRPRNKLALTTGHKIHGWREEELRNRLYINNHVRLKMDNSCVPYFKVLYGIIPYRASSKNAGLQLEKEKFRRVNKTL